MLQLLHCIDYMIQCNQLLYPNKIFQIRAKRANLWLMPYYSVLINSTRERAHAGRRQLSSRSAITDLSCLSTSLFLVIFSTLAHEREKSTSLRSTAELPNNQNPKSGPKDWIKSRSIVIIGSSDPFKFCSESRIRAKIFTKSAYP